MGNTNWIIHHFTDTWRININVMSKKTLTIGLITMVVINVVLIILLIWQSAGHDPRHRHPSGMLVKQLDFSEDQIKQFDQLRSTHFSRVDPKMERIGNLKRALMNAPDSTEARKLTKEIGDLEGQIDYLTYEHFTRVREMCSPEQKEKMDEIKRRMSERMNQMHRGEYRERHGPQ